MYKKICLLISICLLFSHIVTAQELIFEDYNDHDNFNNFSGNWGVWENENFKEFSFSFEKDNCRTAEGMCLKMAYSVPQGNYGGLWDSLLSNNQNTDHFLNFTNLYSPLKNSAGNPANIENIQITQFNFWAKGNGIGSYNHTLKVEFKDVSHSITYKIFTIPNIGGWTRYSFPVSEMTGVDLTRMKEMVFVIEDWRNNKRIGSYLFWDDLSFTTTESTYDASTWDDDAFLDIVSHRLFKYFLTFTDNKGFALDRSTFSDSVSVGAIGYQLSAYCIGHKRGWADGLEAKVETIMQNLLSLPMGPEPETVNAGYKGFYYHLLQADSGLRKKSSEELSLYDTMLLMYGVLSAKQCFPQNATIQSLAQTLYDRVEWDWMIDPTNHQFHLAWKPEQGQEFEGHMDGYTDEALLVDVLALGSGTHPSTIDTYNARSRFLGSYPQGNSNTFAAAWTGSLFNYFFAAGWLDLKKRCDRHPTTPLNIWENNRRAITANQQFCINHQDDVSGDEDDHYTTYNENSWGLTAVDNLVPPSPDMLSEYYAFGALPTQQNIQYGQNAPHLGTIAVYGAGSSIIYLPEVSVATLRNYYSGTSLWSPLFGFGDSYSNDPHYYEINPSTFEPILDNNGNLKIHPATWLNGPWVNRIVMGINVGPMLLAIENYRSGLMWNLMSNNLNVQNGVNAIFTDVDNDEDGYCGLQDCNDTASAINPGVTEVCGDGIDNNCNGQVDEGCGNIPLLTNWNLISLPVQPSDTSIDTVLNTVLERYNIVWAYDAGEWTMNNPATPIFNTLNTMEAGKGYWIYMAQPGTLTVSGSAPYNSIQLASGWNLVGYNSETSQPIADVLVSIDGKYISVWAFIDGDWQFYAPGNIFGTLETMEPGYGYWINANQACAWTLP